MHITTYPVTFPFGLVRHEAATRTGTGEPSVQRETTCPDQLPTLDTRAMIPFSDGSAPSSSTGVTERSSPRSVPEAWSCDHPNICSHMVSQWTTVPWRSVVIVARRSASIIREQTDLGN